ADGGMLEDPKSPPGKLHFARSIPLEKAQADVLLAYKMNGEELPPQNGFPVRAIVPGWYAMASIKWLQRIIVMDEPFTGYYQTIDYAYWKRRAEVAELTPLTEVQVKAQIAKPAEGETVPANSSVRVHGAAWTSDGEITKVELSTDGGSTWNETNLMGQPKPNAWRLWEFNWQTPAAPGNQTLIARATDSLGRTQPALRDDDEGIAAVFDPRADCDVYIEAAREAGVAITHIFETHIHADLVSGSRELCARLDSAKIYASGEGGTHYGFDPEKIKDGDRFTFGEVLVTARHTPGHTPEHMSYLLAEADHPDEPWAVLTGDSLFVSSAGRPDLLGEQHTK